MLTAEHYPGFSTSRQSDDLCASPHSIVAARIDIHLIMNMCCMIAYVY